MNAPNKKQSMYNNFLIWIHKDKPGDPQIIVGSEMILLSIIFLYKFFDSPISYILKLEKYWLFLSVNIGLITITIIGLIILVLGIVIKIRK